MSAGALAIERNNVQGSGDPRQREVPPGWVWVPLSQVTTPVQNADPRRLGKPFQYIDLSAIEAALIQNAQLLEAEQAPSRAKQLVQTGDTLFSGVRVYLKNIALVDDEHDGSIASTAFCVLRPNGALDRKYLHHFVKWQTFINCLLPLQRGNSPPAVLDGDIKAQPIPLPPLVEQQRIVARIDELFAELAEGEAALERARQGLDTWRRALLKAAVSGELTHGWREAKHPTEIAAQLLARIRAERQHAVSQLGRARRPAWSEPIDTRLLPELPVGWVWARLSELGEVTGGLTKNPDRDGFPGKLPFLRVANVQMGRLDLTDMKEIGVRPEERDRLLLAPNDLLVVEGNGSIEQIGRCALWSDEIRPCVHQNHIIKVRFSDPALASWALRWLLSPSGRAHIRAVASSTSGLHTLSIAKIQNLPVPVPLSLGDQFEPGPMQIIRFQTALRCRGFRE
jgi:type I restriction enzyme S subunit